VNLVNKEAQGLRGEKNKEEDENEREQPGFYACFFLRIQCMVEEDFGQY
jgi:hypothetical protein